MSRLIYDVILAPVVTEKATHITGDSQYTFRVPLDATKPEIKTAVEGLKYVGMTFQHIVGCAPTSPSSDYRCTSIIGFDVHDAVSRMSVRATEHDEIQPCRFSLKR